MSGAAGGRPPNESPYPPEGSGCGLIHDWILTYERGRRDHVRVM